jgi:uncharacterized integral membrane protein
VLEKQDTEIRSDAQARGTTHISPKLIVAAVIAVVLVAFVLANTATAEINFLVDTVTAPVWLVLTIVMVVSFGVGLLVGSFRRH